MHQCNVGFSGDQDPERQNKNHEFKSKCFSNDYSLYNPFLQQDRGAGHQVIDKTNEKVISTKHTILDKKDQIIDKVFAHDTFDIGDSEKKQKIFSRIFKCWSFQRH